MPAGFDVVSPTDPITIYFKIALYIAIGIALPVLMWQLIGFLVPGLTKKEKRLLYLSLPFVVALFLGGAARLAMTCLTHICARWRQTLRPLRARPARDGATTA